MVDTSGFVVSLVVNAVIALVVMLIFCAIWQKYDWVYYPRLNDKRRERGKSPPPTGSGYLGWLHPTLHTSDDEYYASAGLDALMLTRFLWLAVKLFAFCTIYGCIVLIPINATDENYETVEHKYKENGVEYTNKTQELVSGIESLSMASVPVGSHRYWAHLIGAYLFAIAAWYLLNAEWKVYTHYRHRFLREQRQQGLGKTLLITHIPPPAQSDQALKALFSKFGNDFESAYVARDTADLQEKVAERDIVIAKLERAQWDYEHSTETPKVRPITATKALCLEKRDAIEFFSEEILRLNKEIIEGQEKINASTATADQFVDQRLATVGKEGNATSISDTLAATTDSPASAYTAGGFVTLKSALSVHAARFFHFATQPYTYLMKPAPAPTDIVWSNVAMPAHSRSVRNILMKIALFLLIIFWAIPVAFIQGICNLKTLGEKLPFLEPIIDLNPGIRGFLEGFLPGLATIIFFALLPMFLTLIASGKGIEARSWINIEVVESFFLFVVINFFFGNILAGSLFNSLTQILGAPLSLADILGAAIPKVGTFFLNYVAMAAFAGSALQMLLPGPLIVSLIFKKWLAKTPREIEAAEKAGEYPVQLKYPTFLYVWIIAFAYAPIYPLVLPFAAIFFAFNWLVNRYQSLYVYNPSYETGGSFWPTLFDRMIAAMVIAQLTLIGLFGLKQVPAPTVLVLPLPLITLQFYLYCNNGYKPHSELLPFEEVQQLDAIDANNARADGNDGMTTPLLKGTESNSATTVSTVAITVREESNGTDGTTKRTVQVAYVQQELYAVGNLPIPSDPAASAAVQHVTVHKAKESSAESGAVNGTNGVSGGQHEEASTVAFHASGELSTPTPVVTEDAANLASASNAHA